MTGSSIHPATRSQATDPLETTMSTAPAMLTRLLRSRTGFLTATVLAAGLTSWGINGLGSTVATADAAPGGEKGKPGAETPPDPVPTVLAGAAAVNITPRPDLADPLEFPAARWEHDIDACSTLSESIFTEVAENTTDTADHLAAAGTPWPENPDCIYMGGFGIGPMNPIVEVDPGHGLWVRAFSVGDGTDTAAIAVVDGEGWLWDYANKCADCGSKQIAQTVADATGIDPSGVVVAATHAHSAPDFIGGWGFVPDWYMAQVHDAIVEALTTAVTEARPAMLEAGETSARSFNRERRDTYRSAEEQQLTWLRAVGVDAESRPVADDVVFTVGAYAAHPTTFGTNDGQGHADWPGAFVDRLEARFGGVGVQLMSGLGNMSASGMGRGVGGDGLLGQERLADLVPTVGQGNLVADTDLTLAQATWRQPITNAPLTALGLPGFFDRQFDPQPAALRTGKSPDTAPCLSSSPYSVELPATALRFGQDFALTTAPGEVFSNVTNTIKEQGRATVTMPVAQANDALGYMPQQFELNEANQTGLGFVAGGVLIVNYEDSYAVDRCVGDMALETIVGLLQTTAG